MAIKAYAVPLEGERSEGPEMGLAIAGLHDDPAETVARISAGRRSRLLRIYRRRLRLEDLEDCYSQATLELVARSRRDPFVSDSHVEHALELRFKSRIDDRRRAIGGRSPIESAIARAVSVDASAEDGQELEDRAAAVERQVMARTEIARLREVIADLTRDQQLVLGSQVLVDMEAGEFCARHGWSSEKYRKVAQRARGKLRVLVDEYEAGERCRRFEPDLLAVSAGVAGDEVTVRVRAHLANCAACARALAELDRSARSVAALLPAPAAVAGGVAGRFAGPWSALRRLLGLARHPVVEGGASSGAGVAGGSLASAGVLKVGIAAFCVAGAAGGYAACAHLGVLPSIVLPPVTGAPASHHHARPVHHDPRHRVSNRAGGLTRPPSRASASVASTDSAPTATVSPTSTVAQTVHPIAATDLRAHHRRRAHRLTKVEQIRREFGSSPARAAAASGTSSAATGASTTIGSVPATHAAVAPSATTVAPRPAASTSSAPPQSRSQAVQTQAEFGFEK